MRDIPIAEERVILYDVPDLPAEIIVEYEKNRLTLGENGTLREFRK